RILTLVKASGTVQVVVSVDVSSQLSGRIAEVFVNFNDSVTAGQPIAQIDQEIFAARVKEARAALRVARATAQVEKAALERAKVAVANAQTAERLAEDQASAKQGQARRSGEGIPAKARAGTHRKRHRARLEPGALSARCGGRRPARLPSADPDESRGHCDRGSRTADGRRQSRECASGCRAEA